VRCAEQRGYPSSLRIMALDCETVLPWPLTKKIRVSGGVSKAALFKKASVTVRDETLRRSDIVRTPC